MNDILLDLSKRVEAKAIEEIETLQTENKRLKAKIEHVKSAIENDYHETDDLIDKILWILE